MSKHILIIGPSGSGKTYISATLRKQGVNAPDADLVDGLSGWFGAGGKQISYPADANKEFLDNHEFLWDKNFLQKFLQEQGEVYLFGMSGNVFDMVDLFDKVYFLKTSLEVIAERLRHESRKNPMGKTDYQLENALNWAKEIEETANKLDIQMIDANQSPEQIFSQISNKGTSKKVIFFDVYQTLIDIDINDENKKKNQASAWENFAKSLEAYGVKIKSAELIELNKKQQENFYIGKDKKIQHHNFCKILGEILKNSFGVEIPEEKICSLIYEYHKIARGYSRLYPDVAETLARLKEKYILSIASYTQRCFTKSEFIELGIDKYFSYFVYTSDIGFHKASPKFYERCLEIIGERAENCVMVGDNYDVDILIPQKLGIKTIWVKNPLTAHQYTHLFEQEPKNMINLAEFAKLPEVIERIFN